jgi:hypothetical protein
MTTEAESGAGNEPAEDESTILGDAAENADDKSSEVQSKEDPAQKSEEAGDKADADKSDDGKGDGKGDKAEGAPEKYEDFTVPEGIELDTEAVGEFSELARDLNLNQDQAQKLVDLQVKLNQAHADDAWGTWETVQSEWKGQTQNDAEIGGKSFDESIGHAKSFIKQFGSEGLIEALNVTGAGNHPEIVRAFARAGKAMADDSFHAGTQGGETRTAEEILYPNQGQK